MVPSYAVQMLSSPMVSDDGDFNLFGGIAGTLLSFAAQVASSAWTLCYITVMYIDQRRRLEMPQPVWGGQPLVQQPFGQQPPLPWQTTPHQQVQWGQPQSPQPPQWGQPDWNRPADPPQNPWG